MFDSFFEFFFVAIDLTVLICVVDDQDYVRAMIEQLPLPPELNKLIDDVTAALLKAGHNAPTRNEALNIVGTFDPAAVVSAPPPPPLERRYVDLATL